MLSDKNNVLPTMSHEIERLYGEVDRLRVSVCVCECGFMLRKYLTVLHTESCLFWGNTEKEREGGGQRERERERERERRVEVCLLCMF